MAEIPQKKNVQPEARLRETTERPESEQLLKWKRNGTKVHWQLIDGSALIGSINWWDNYTIQVKADDLGDVTIPKHSIL